jgi:hypothetical protein
MENHAWNLAPPTLPDGALAGDSGRARVRFGVSPASALRAATCGASDQN